MTMMIQSLFKTLFTSRKNTNHQLMITGQNIWQDTGAIYYLLETLKISYHGQYGLVSFENINLQGLEQLLAHIEDTATTALAQRVTAGQQDSINLSVCGVTWQQLNGKLRIKAINEAALLRATTPDFHNSQAVFKHGSFTADDANSATSHAIDRSKVQTYSHISPQEFIVQLQQANARLPARFQQANYISKQNFYQPFTHKEQLLLSQKGYF